MNKRVILLILDSVGIGGAKDSSKFGNEGADTIGNIAKYCIEKNIKLEIPNLLSLGIGFAHNLSTKKELVKNYGTKSALIGSYGVGQEISKGKDTPSGHWEIAGVPVLFDWGYFEKTINSFPQYLLDKIVHETGIPGYIGNCHASGTQILKILGKQHIKTNKPIFYTSIDSVFQIACHEDSFGLDNLYTLCEIIRNILDQESKKIGTIGRVIARPFTGKNSDDFKRTANRKDWSIIPPSPTILSYIEKAGYNVIAIGKISDIYAHQGITKKIKVSKNYNIFKSTLNEINSQSSKNSIIVSNFVDFDTEYGHRRDIEGYARALEEFDFYIPKIINSITDEDLLIITADHGCDPTFHGTDHTRENIPILVYKHGIEPVNIGIRETFSDIGKSISDYFNIDSNIKGKSFLPLIKIK